MDKTIATVTLKNLANYRVTALDSNGYATEIKVKTKVEDKNLIIELPPNIFYIMVQKN